ncbi:MAG: outer membrane protein assembly factor BamE [Pseudomonadota bacterium]
MPRLRNVIRLGCGVTLALALSACSATFRNHGYIPPAEDLDQLVVGIDTRASVEEIVGSPGASGATDGGDYYYVRSRMRTFGPFEPQVIERQVLAISFDSAGVMQNIERFGLEDGRVVRLQSRVTDSGVSDQTFLRQLIGNIGRFSPAGLGG